MDRLLEKKLIVNDFLAVRKKVETAFGSMMPTDKKDKIVEKAIFAQLEYPAWDMDKCMAFGYECMLQDTITDLEE